MSIMYFCNNITFYLIDILYINQLDYVNNLLIRVFIMSDNSKNNVIAFQEVTQKFVVRPFKEEEWEAFKMIRIKALTDDMGMFKRESGVEFSYSEQQWRDCIKSTNCCNIGAFVEGTSTPVAVGIICVDQNHPDELMVGGAWVDKNFRGRNLPEKMFGVVSEWVKAHPELKYFTAAHRDGNENSKMTMRKLGLLPDYVEKGVVWLDGQVADKYFYRAPIMANAINAQYKVDQFAKLKRDPNNQR